VLNDPQNTDLTTQKEIRKPDSSKREKAVSLEWKRNETRVIQMNQLDAIMTF